MCQRKYNSGFVLKGLFGHNERVPALISRATFFCDPHPAFSAAVCSSLYPGLAGTVRVRLIGLPQAGHKGFRLRLSPPMVEILTSKANRAVMAVTIERGFLPPGMLCLLAYAPKVTRRSAKGCRRGYLVNSGSCN
jgi:hypothetical protein